MGKVQSVNEIIEINEVFQRKTSLKSLKSMKSAEIVKTDYIADKLVEIYKSPSSRNFFLKCAWHLSEDQIWTAVERSRSKRIKTPVKYFVACCYRLLQEIPL